MERRNISLFWPLLLLSAGAILLLNNLGMVNVGRGWQAVFRLWPLLLVAGGLDSLFRRDGFVGPVLFTGVGAMFLLVNLGFLDWGSWSVLLRFWPVLLIAFGLDVMIGRRRGFLAGLVGVLLGLALIGGIVGLVVYSPSNGATQVETFQQPQGSLEDAILQVEMAAGSLELQGGASRGNLVDGSLTLANGETVSRDLVPQGNGGRFIMGTQGPTLLLPLMGGNSKWELKLSGDLPLDLESQLISGSQVLDLKNVQLAEGSCETIFGRSEITLPDSGELDLKATVMIGELILHIPADVPVNIEVGRGLTSFQLPPGYVREGSRILQPGRSGDGAMAMQLQLNVPIGTIRIEESD